MDNVPCFQWFKSFDEMFAHGIHRSTQAGIAGKASGATSVVLCVIYFMFPSVD